MIDEEIDIIRVDLPHTGGNTRWFFVERSDEKNWHSWWGELFRLLLSLRPREPVGLDQENSPVEQAKLSGEKLDQFAAVIAEAPRSEIERHRTLRSASRLSFSGGGDLTVRYFRKAPHEAK